MEWSDAAAAAMSAHIDTAKLGPPRRSQLDYVTDALRSSKSARALYQEVGRGLAEHDRAVTDEIIERVI